jgi:hypothetical protein
MDAERRARERDPVIEAYKKDVDRTLIRENLKLTPSQRLEAELHARDRSGRPRSDG